MEFKEGKLVWHKALGHHKLLARTKFDNSVIWGVMVKNKVSFDKPENFQLSCLNFKVGQAIKYTGTTYAITALEEQNNRIVVKTSGSELGTKRFALIPTKCVVIEAEQLRVVLVNERNEIIKEMCAYGMESTE